MRPSMTRQTHIDAIRKAAIAVNPEIVELKFGVFVRGRSRYLPETDGYVVQSVGDDLWVICSDEYGTFGNFRRSELEIIGRPLTLADILLVIESVILNRCIFVSGSGRFYEERADGSISLLGIKWNLRLPFEDQSDELLAFIASLIETK